MGTLSICNSALNIPEKEKVISNDLKIKIQNRIKALSIRSSKS